MLPHHSPPKRMPNMLNSRPAPRVYPDRAVQPGPLLFGLALVLFLPGCGSRLIRVSGEITLDGEPVRHGHVLLIAVDPNVAPNAGVVLTAGSKCKQLPAKRRWSFAPPVWTQGTRLP